MHLFISQQKYHSVWRIKNIFPRNYNFLQCVSVVRIMPRKKTFLLGNSIICQGICYLNRNFSSSF
uniref:Uncharacterized protein n=1 Tax=Daphnia magna TaxID=35525 RepID=A0A0P6B9T7_9CRUS